jgi:hypothetical protein
MHSQKREAPLFAWEQREKQGIWGEESSYIPFCSKTSS